MPDVNQEIERGGISTPEKLDYKGTNTYVDQKTYDESFARSLAVEQQKLENARGIESQESEEKSRESNVYTDIESLPNHTTKDLSPSEKSEDHHNAKSEDKNLETALPSTSAMEGSNHDPATEKIGEPAASSPMEDVSKSTPAQSNNAMQDVEPAANDVVESSNPMQEVVSSDQEKNKPAQQENAMSDVAPASSREENPSEQSAPQQSRSF